MTVKPYSFQKDVARRLLEGRSVILQAPTGAGKTHAALLPFLDALEHDRDFPRRCLYAVPMRVLANQFVDDYGHRVRRAGRDDRIRVAVQTGEHSDDRDLSATLTFATIDQLLSSFLMAPYSLPKRLSNLNAGAVASAYLVFDEFHLFDPTSTLPTTMEMLRILSGITPFLLMTATFSAGMLEGLGEALDADIVPSDAVQRLEMSDLPSQAKVRRHHVIDAPLTAATVLERHRQRSLVICNTVDRARALFESLRRHPDLGDTQVQLLHSRFLPQDRAGIERHVRVAFSGQNPAGSHILVATQVIEVGLDITSDVLHTELAPANAILQRAGRCARRKGEEGDIFVYTDAMDPQGELVDLRERIAPYFDQREIIARTLESLGAVDGRALTFADEQALVNDAHGPSDARLLEGLRAGQGVHRGRMARVMNGEPDVTVSHLVREVDSQVVVIHDDPAFVARAPFSLERFSIHPGTLRGQVARWETEGSLSSDRVLLLGDDGDTDESGRTRYAWRPVRSARDVKGASLVLIHPDLAGYDTELGLLLDRATGYRAQTADAHEREATGPYHYTLETYGEHATRVMEAFMQSVWPSLAGPAAQLEAAWGWPAGALARTAHLVALLHDMGKLNQSWQTWVRRYQAIIRRPVRPGEAYAHTDADPNDPDHTAAQQALGRRPSHAVEGAWAAQRLLEVAAGGVEPILKGAFTAIARHHGAFVRQGSPYALVANAAALIDATLTRLPEEHRVGLSANLIVGEGDPHPGVTRYLLVDAQADDEVLAYAFLARALRLADQQGTSTGTAQTPPFSTS